VLVVQLFGAQTGWKQLIPQHINTGDANESALRDQSVGFVEVGGPDYCEAGGVSACIADKGSLRIAVYKDGINSRVSAGDEK